ncbi:MAG: TrmH family RNA methyltransferase [Saprospiraceae bacterium]
MSKPINFQDERPDFATHLLQINQHRHPISLLLDGLTLPNNIGAAFRLADAANLQHIYFYRCSEFAQSKKWKRIARATHKYVPYTFLKTLAEIETLQISQQLIALEWTKTSMPFRKFQPVQPVILVLGSEQRGVSEEVLNLAQRAIHIPMYGVNTSMNVAMAAGIVTYDLVDKVKQNDLFTNH